MLLLDEPTAGQDPGAVAALLDALRRIVPDAAVVMATHDLDLARSASTRVMLIRGGEVVASGAANEVEVDVRPDNQLEPSLKRSEGGLDPRIRLILLGCVGALAVLLDRPLALALLAGLSAAMLLSVGLTPIWRRRALALTMGVVWSTTLSQGLFYGDVPRVALIELGPIVIWREGITHGLVQSLRMLAPAYSGVALALSTPPDRLLGALTAIRVPWSVGFLAATALRFVPLVGQEVQVVRSAWRQRGRAVWRRPPWQWLALEARMLQPVVARTLRRGRHLAASLDARGFDPDRVRTSKYTQAPPFSQVSVACLSVLMVVAVGFVELLYWAYLAEVLYIPALRPLYGWVRFWL